MLSPQSRKGALSRMPERFRFADVYVLLPGSKRLHEMASGHSDPEDWKGLELRGGRGGMNGAHYGYCFSPVK